LQEIGNDTFPNFSGTPWLWVSCAKKGEEAEKAEEKTTSRSIRNLRHRLGILWLHKRAALSRDTQFYSAFERRHSQQMQMATPPDEQEEAE
jgi:hypothetical protein